MPRGAHLHRVRPSKEKRLQALGWEALEPGEETVQVRVRGDSDLLKRFIELSPKRRGQVIKLGLQALEVEHGEKSG